MPVSLRTRRQKKRHHQNDHDHENYNESYSNQTGDNVSNDTLTSIADDDNNEAVTTGRNGRSNKTIKKQKKQHDSDTSFESKRSSEEKGQNNKNNKGDDNKGNEKQQQEQVIDDDNHNNDIENDIFLMMILSPAKTLNMDDIDEDDHHHHDHSSSFTTKQKLLPNCNIDKTNYIMSVMKYHCTNKSTEQLSKLLGNLSKPLTQTAKTYWKNMIRYNATDTDIMVNNNNNNDAGGDDVDNDDTRKKQYGKPCGLAFAGAAYQGLQFPQLYKETVMAKTSTSTTPRRTTTTTTNTNPIKYLQDRLRIVDPLYGWLRPMDMIQPYRLEMATKNLFDVPDKVKKQQTLDNDDDDNNNNKSNKKLKQYKHLADFWKPAIQNCLQREAMERHQYDKVDNNGSHDDNDKMMIKKKKTKKTTIVIVNLASEEYSAAVDITPLTKMQSKDKDDDDEYDDDDTNINNNTKNKNNNVSFFMIKIIFRQEGRVIAVHAKRARGLMVRYMATNNVRTIHDITKFDWEGYKFCCHPPPPSTTTTKKSNNNNNNHHNHENQSLPTEIIFDRSKNWATSSSSTGRRKNKK